MSWASAEERFWARVARVDDLLSCWLWVGPVWGTGYGSIMVKGRATSPHRFSYELHVGPIPAGLYIDHLCRVRRCVRPDHLEAVTNGENVRRGEGWTATNRRKTTCPEGHPYDRVDPWNRARVCSTCKNRQARERYAARMSRKREAAMAEA